MKKIFLFTILWFCARQGFSQDNIGTPYSIYGFGLIPENTGAYTAMGGVGAAMRDNMNINYLNPASYTALDSNHFYFQLGVTGEYTYLSTHKESSQYRVAQNAAMNMAFRLYQNLYFSLGFTEKSDIGYDLLYTTLITGSDNAYFNQNIEGEGGLNDIYVGLGWRYKNFSIGLNTSYVFGKIEKRQTLSAQLENSYMIRTSENNRINNVLFEPGVQYVLKLSPKSVLTLGSTFNFTQRLRAKKEFISYQINSGTGSTTTPDDVTLNRGYIKYPFRIASGFNYSYKNRWEVAGDYTFQKMSDYEEFGKSQMLKNYHRGSAGLSWLPSAHGRYWRQRNKYMVGGYYVKSPVRIKNTDINTYGVTAGLQMPFITQRSGTFVLGAAIDLGIRGTEKNGLIQEKFVKLRINIAFNEYWFIKRKIN